MRRRRRERAPASPCVGICLMDPATRQCRGCLRTVAEIAAWYEAGAAEKRAILARIAGRREAVQARRRKRADDRVFRLLRARCWRASASSHAGCDLGGGNAGGHWTKAGADEAATAREYRDCRGLARDATRKETDRHIDQDIAATRGADLQHSMIVQARQSQMQDTTRRSAESIIAACMRQKGFYDQRPTTAPVGSKGCDETWRSLRARVEQDRGG